MAIDVTQPIALATVRKIVEKIIESNGLIFTQHALEELAKDELDPADAEKVLRSGAYSGPEWERGGWRYRSEGRATAVIFELEPDDCCIVITGWKLGK